MVLTSADGHAVVIAAYSRINQPNHSADIVISVTLPALSGIRGDISVVLERGRAAGRIPQPDDTSCISGTCSCSGVGSGILHLAEVSDVLHGGASPHVCDEPLNQDGSIIAAMPQDAGPVVIFPVTGPHNEILDHPVAGERLDEIALVTGGAHIVVYFVPLTVQYPDERAVHNRLKEVCPAAIYVSCDLDRLAVRIFGKIAKEAFERGQIGYLKVRVDIVYGAGETNDLVARKRQSGAALESPHDGAAVQFGECEFEALAVCARQHSGISVEAVTVVYGEECMNRLAVHGVRHAGAFACLREGYACLHIAVSGCGP